MVAVVEVEDRMLLEAGGKRRLLKFNIIPADVRKLEAWVVDRQSLHPPRQPSQSFEGPILMADIGQQLQSQTNPKERLSFLPHLLRESVHQASCAQVRDAVAEGSLSGQHDPVGCTQVLRLGRDRDSRADRFERLGDGAQVAHAIVHYRNSHDSAPIPLVLIPQFLPWKHGSIIMNVRADDMLESNGHELFLRQTDILEKNIEAGRPFAVMFLHQPHGLLTR